MEKYSQFRDRGTLHTQPVFIQPLTLFRLGNRTILSYTYSIIRHLSAFPSLLTPHSPTNNSHGYFELLFCITMAADWIFRKESVFMAHTWYARGLVDRSSN